MIEQSPVVRRVLAAQQEGLRPNAERFLAFLGRGPIELQILGGRERYAENKYAHPKDAADAVRLIDLADNQKPTGIYVLFNCPDEAVTARSEQGTWHPQKKGESTTDADVTARRALFIDVDWARARGTSSTDADCVKALEGAAAIFEMLREHVPTESLGLGHSGNGGSVFVALNHLEETPHVAGLVREALAVLHLRYTDPRIQGDKNLRNGIEIDTSVCDAKRLCPAYGSTKRKGAAGNAERPHRRTAFIGSTSPHRLSLSELEALVQKLRAPLTEEQREKVDRELGRKPASAPVRRAPASRARASSPEPDPFARANRVPIADVLSWLGLLDGDQPTCPGCKESDGSAVAVVGNGLKCLHNRCSSEGVKAGFRTVVDVVCTARRLEPIDAVRELGERFGFEVAEPKKPRSERKAPEGPSEELPPEAFLDDPPPTDEDAPDAPPKGKGRARITLLPQLRDLGPWTLDIKTNQYGVPDRTYGNLCLVLRHAYGERLTYDEMRATPYLDGRPLGDADVGRVREELERVYAIVMRSNDVIDGVRHIAEERRFHPVQSYLRSLKWDAKVRLPDIARRVLGSEEPLHARMVVAWFVQAVKRALEPGCKADAALVLVGDQGYFKSTFFSTLAGPFFSDTKMDISSRDGLMQLAASWIYEWSELENVTSRKQASEVKAFITSQFDTFRLPFGKAIVQHPRSSVIVGSTNEEQFLTDVTGSRRFWCVTVPRRIPKDALLYLREVRDQLWAEAVVNLESGYQSFLSLDEEIVREQLAERHQVSDVFEDAIGQWLTSRKARELELMHGWITCGDVMEFALGIEKARWERGTQTRIGTVMKRLGWAHVRREHRAERRHVWVYVRTERAASATHEQEAMFQ